MVRMRFTARAVLFLSVCRKRNGKMRGTFRRKAKETKKAPAGAFQQPSRTAHTACRKYPPAPAARFFLPRAAHWSYTDSALARRMLDDWQHYVQEFIQVIPIEYKKVMQEEKDRKLRERISSIWKEF